jgi:uncharacterized membrane protein
MIIEIEQHTSSIISKLKNRIIKPYEKRSQGMYDAWHDDPSNWKLGIFYFNKLDKRVFPPKRIQWFGWTVNFAHPYSYLTMLGVIIALIVIGFCLH